MVLSTEFKLTNVGPKILLPVVASVIWMLSLVIAPIDVTSCKFGVVDGAYEAEIALSAFTACEALVAVAANDADIEVSEFTECEALIAVEANEALIVVSALTAWEALIAVVENEELIALSASTACEALVAAVANEAVPFKLPVIPPDTFNEPVTWVSFSIFTVPPLA